MNKEISKSFALYANKTESDYFIRVGDDVVPTHSTILLKEEASMRIHHEENLSIYKNEFIEKLSPDKIDSREFWKTATDNFPLFSIGGGVQNISTVYEVNMLTFLMAKNLGVIEPVNKLFMDNGNSKILEIGPGYGGFKDYIKQTFGDKNYWAVDVNPLFKHPRIYQTDGKNIPDTIPNPMDIVYSVNVFQHLSKNQRTSYYKQIFEVLKVGGVFIFGMFVLTPENKDWPCWGTKGENGKFYCNFFRQFTEIDSIKDLNNEMELLGFEMERLSNTNIQSNYITFKCTKIKA